MNIQHCFKALGLLTAGMLLAAPVQAQKNELLNTLVQKGYLTQAEAEQIASSEKAPVIKPAGSSVQSLTISGRLHLQYDYLSLNDKSPAVNPAAVNQFLLRRVRLGAKADLGNGWSGFINTEFGDDNARLSDAIITRKFDDYGSATLGYQKVTFGFEENTSSSRIKAVERSLASRYWAEGFNNRRLGFGSRHVGIFWKGYVPGLDGLSYGLELVNSQGGGSFSNLGVNNQMGYYWNVAYSGAFDQLKYKLGVNMGYQTELRDTAAGIGGATFGWNPYVELNYDRASLMAEVLGADIKDGKGPGGTGGSATPIGFNVIPSYKITDELEAVFRYSHLRTNGRGINPSDGIRNSPNPTANPTFNVANSFYFGGNWYIKGNDIKLSAGYEYAQFSDRGAGFANKDKVDDNAIRVRLQLLF